MGDLFFTRKAGAPTAVVCEGGGRFGDVPDCLRLLRGSRRAASTNAWSCYTSGTTKKQATAGAIDTFSCFELLLRNFTCAGWVQVVSPVDAPAME
jgi:hypothetical protein